MFLRPYFSFAPNIQKIHFFLPNTDSIITPNLRQQVSLENNINFVVMKKRKAYSAGFKTKVVLEVLQERETVQEIARKYDLHWLPCVETRKKDVKPGEKSDKKEEKVTFEYVTNIIPSKDNVIALTSGGRLRWKIENEGFNTQKQGGYELKHKYCRKSYFGMKNCYNLLQIAHFINQLVEKGKVVVAILREYSKQTIKNIWSNLISCMLMIMPRESWFRPSP